MTKKTKTEDAFFLLLSMLEKYAEGFSKATGGNNKKEFHLWTKKPAKISGRTLPRIYFAGIIRHLDFVSFYFMPIYADKDTKASVPAGLKKHLKGKNCFHFKGLDAKTAALLNKIIKAGLLLYKAKGWV